MKGQYTPRVYFKIMEVFKKNGSTYQTMRKWNKMYILHFSFVFLWTRQKTKSTQGFRHFLMFPFLQCGFQACEFHKTSSNEFI